MTDQNEHTCERCVRLALMMQLLPRVGCLATVVRCPRVKARAAGGVGTVLVAAWPACLEISHAPNANRTSWIPRLSGFRAHVRCASPLVRWDGERHLVSSQRRCPDRLGDLLAFQSITPGVPLRPPTERINQRLGAGSKWQDHQEDRRFASSDREGAQSKSRMRLSQDSRFLYLPV